MILKGSEKMFAKGDKIVYPMYGAGIIEEVEKSGLDDGDLHYIIRIPNGNLRIKVASKKAELIGIRPVYDEERIINEIKDAASRPIVFQKNWNIRYKENLEKIKSGKLCDVAEVAKALMLREKERNLSGVEKKMLNNAKQIIISEIILSQNIAKDLAEEFLAKKLL
jgi:CarD family transcriptional regulator